MSEPTVMDNPNKAAMERAKELAADAIEAAMGPVFGSPEYLADPVKLARAEKRRRDGALTYANVTLAALTEHFDLIPKEVGRGN